MKGDIGIHMRAHTLRTRRDTVPRNQPYHYETTFTQSEVDLAGKFDEIYVFAERQTSRDYEKENAFCVIV